MIEDSNESIDNIKYKPESMLPNEWDYYFGSEEILRFNEGKFFLGIIGNNWFSNQTDDEFAEAIIFGNHNIKEIDCMLGSVRVNNPFNSKKYLRPGSLVVLQRAEFKKTKYLEVSSFLTHLYTEYDSKSVWFFSRIISERFHWNGTEYSYISSVRNDDLKDEGYDEDNKSYDNEDSSDDTIYETNYRSNSSYDDDDDSYDEYGGGPNGDLTDNYIDSVFDGDPSNYWNVD